MNHKEYILAEYDEKSELYHKFAATVERILKTILCEKGIDCNCITSRLKDRDSLDEKIYRKNKYCKLEDLTDIAGIRVVTYYSEDVDKVAKVIEEEFTVDRKNSIDKRAALEPDRFGYCSLHYIVEMSPTRLSLTENMSYIGLKCEIQIRSFLQHVWAEFVHDLGYKSKKEIPVDIQRNYSRLAGLLEIADKEFQEIRHFLSDYEEKVSAKIDDLDFEDTVLDAIVLKKFIQTDKNVSKFNEYISSKSNYTFKEPLTYDCEKIIKELNYLGVHTLGQLRAFIGKNYDAAIVIVERLILSEDIKGINFRLAKTMIFFYLCYAELVNNEKYEEDEIMYYLEKNDIGEDYDDRMEFANELLSMRKKIETA